MLACGAGRPAAQPALHVATVSHLQRLLEAGAGPVHLHGVFNGQPATFQVRIVHDPRVVCDSRCAPAGGSIIIIPRALR